MEELESRVSVLRGLIAKGDEVLSPLSFEAEVDDLIHLFYADIGTIKQISLKSLFDLFLIKVLYVGRGEKDFFVLEYLSELLSRFLWSRELFRFNARYDFLYSLLEDMKERSKFQNLFEAARHLADNALFITGIFPSSRPWRRGRRRWAQPRFDRAQFIELGQRYYRVAAAEQLAEVVGQRPVLLRIAGRFPFYVEGLNELSQRYILGFDMNVVADKMLDAWNLYRRTGDQQFLDQATRYASILKVDPDFRGLRHTPRIAILGGDRRA
jgi:hypothetical protein